MELKDVGLFAGVAVTFVLGVWNAITNHVEKSTYDR